MRSPALQETAAVVIGASAGGVEALGMLLPALDARCRATVLIVVHLPRERPSLMPTLFTSKCRLPICEVIDKQPVEPGTVCFAPPDYHLLVDCQPDGSASLALSVDEPVLYSRPSIDVLFESAAECWGERLVGVILTGGNDDGARGLSAIARAGGITVAQDPAEAVVPAMPAAAVRTGQVQHVLPLAGIADLLARVGYRS